MKRKHFEHFLIAGFTYYEGALVFNKMEIGSPLLLKVEPENRYDKNAVEIYFEDTKIGYIPKQSNKAISSILNSGNNIFEAYVQMIAKDMPPEHQVQVIVYTQVREVSIA